MTDGALLARAFFLTGLRRLRVVAALLAIVRRLRVTAVRRAAEVRTDHLLRSSTRPAQTGPQPDGASRFTIMFTSQRDMFQLWASGAEQVPSVAFDIQEHRDVVVCLAARSGNEPDSGGHHSRVGGRKIVCPQEEPDPTGELVTDDGGLPVAVCPREEDPGLAADRSNDHPPLGAPVVGDRRNILVQLELEHVHEEVDGRRVLRRPGRRARDAPSAFT